MKNKKSVNKSLNHIAKIINRLSESIDDLYKRKEEPRPIVPIEQDKSSPKLLLIAEDEYYWYLHNQNVRSHEMRDRGSRYIERLLRAIKILNEAIINNGNDISGFTVAEINQDVVGWFHNELKKYNFAKRTLNDYRSNINAFEIWLLEKGYLSKRCFIKIKKLIVSTNPKSITQTEFTALIRRIIDEPSKYRELNDIKHRDHYQPWLAEGLQLSLELGGRMDDIMNFRFCHIIEENGQPALIKMEDFKYNTQHKLSDEGEKKYKSLPITKNLIFILNKYGYNEKKGSKEFVFLSDITSIHLRNGVIPRILKTGFSYYYAKLNTGRHLTFKSLRKAAITSQYLQSGGHPEYLSGHNSHILAVNHYVDKDEIAKHYTKMGYSVFPKEEDDALNSNEMHITANFSNPLFNKKINESFLSHLAKYTNEGNAFFDPKTDSFGIIQGEHPFIYLRA